jgi:hypothetical protein
MRSAAAFARSTALADAVPAQHPRLADDEEQHAAEEAVPERERRRHHLVAAGGRVDARRRLVGVADLRDLRGRGVRVVQAPALVDVVVVVQQLHHPELGHHDGPHDVAEGIADLRDGRVVPGIDHAEEQRLAAQLAREHLVALGEPLGHGRDRLGPERLQVDRGHAVRARQRVGQALLGDEAELVEARAEPAAVEHLVLDGLLQLSVRDHPAVAQDSSEDGQ